MLRSKWLNDLHGSSQISFGTEHSVSGLRKLVLSPVNSETWGDAGRDIGLPRRHPRPGYPEDEAKLNLDSHSGRLAAGPLILLGVLPRWACSHQKCSATP